MLQPQQAINDLNNEASKDSEAEKKYTDNTAYKQQVVDLDMNFSDGSVKITKELASVAKLAVELRIKNTADYTEKRINNVNENLKQYYSDVSVANDNKSLAKVFLPETFNAVEDWSDDLYLMFENMVDDLRIEEVGDSIDQFITKSLEVTEVDDEKKISMLRSLARFVFGKDNTAEKDSFYFRKLDVIKSFLKRGLVKSKFQDKIEKWLTMGINSGLFILKDDWGPTGEYKLCSKDKNYKYELDQEDVYRFNPVDSRLCIFPKQGNFPWMIEKIPTTFHELLNIVMDVDGKPKKNPKYDIKSLKILAEYLKDVGASEVKVKDYTLEGYDGDQIQTEDKDLWDMDGNITLYECHAIPLLINKGNTKIPYKCMITCVNTAENNDKEPSMLPIGIQATPYIAGLPYLTTNFVEKDGDVAGIGLPELIRPLQTMLNNLTGHSVDILNLALWGIMVIDPDVFKDTAKLKEMTPRLILQLKNMKGRNVKDVIEWMHPPLETIGAMGEMFSMFQEALKRTSRKGPTGEKIAPNPSATEFESISSEQLKSVNKVGLRINNLFGKFLERMYIYNIMNMKENVRMKSQSYRLKDQKKTEQTLETILKGETDNPEGQYSMNEKSIELSPEELFIDGLSFTLDAADTFNKKAVEKQQAMQVLKTLKDTGAITNEDGSIHIMTDDTGQKVFLSEYRLYKRLMDIFDYDDLFEKVEGSQEAPAPEQGVEGMAPQGMAGMAPSTPQLTASPETADIGQQATTISQGINA